MAELIISPEAESDLIKIWLQMAEDSPVNADRFLDKLDEKAQKLAETDLRVERLELGKDMKSFPVDRYVLLYRTVLSSLVCPGSNCTALRFFVRL